MRTGIGYDIHRLKEGRKLILGGVDIKWPKGLGGHSDADVVIHAVCDALLGASSMGDIGRHFPDTDMKWKDSSSISILEIVKEKIGRDINNIDVTVICEEPKLQPYIPQMRKNIADVLDMSEKDVNIKATTNEGLGPVGSGEAIAAIAVATTIPGVGNV